MSAFSFEIDPYLVLGVGRDASLAEIRDAYRQKAKRYHPDGGGEEWAFRVLVQAFELLSTARVVRATQASTTAGASAPRGAAAAGARGGEAAGGWGPSRSRAEPRSETVHPGLFDRDVPPERIVAVEHLCVRYLWDDIDFLWLTQKAPDEERFLSCSLNLSWPDPTLAQADRSLSLPTSEAESVLAALEEIFDHLVVATRAVSSRSRIEDDRFAGWLSYSGFDRSWKALKMLHEALRSHKLGLRHWSRDLFIPRDWRGPAA